MTTVASAPITASERVSDVLARDESLVDVFVRHAPHFSKLRNRAMRRIMARLVTVEQAARTANVPVAELLRDLNETIGIRAASADAARATEHVSSADRADATHPASRREAEVDVRDDLRAGREPFSKIMTAVGRLQDDEVLHLRAIFEPAPLFAVLAARGFEHESVSHAPDDWSVWFWRPVRDQTAAAPVQVGERSADDPVPEDDEPTLWLDVRGLQPPEPMLRTLTALETLPPGHVLVQVNSRVPQFLFPVLAERGFACEVDESRHDRVLVRIWHARS